MEKHFGEIRLAFEQSFKGAAGRRLTLTKDIVERSYANCIFRRRRSPYIALIQYPGQVHNLSSSVCVLDLIVQPAWIEAGMWADLRVDWPAKLHGEIALQLNVSGRVLSADGPRIVVAIRRYRIEVRGKGFSEAVAPGWDSRLSGEIAPALEPPPSG